MFNYTKRETVDTEKAEVGLEESDVAAEPAKLSGASVSIETEALTLDVLNVS